MTRKQWAARELEIDEHSSEEEATVAYRDLATVWHPDLHRSIERLREKAEEKSKRINLAYEVFLGRDILTPIPGASVERDADPVQEGAPESPRKPSQARIVGASEGGRAPRSEADEVKEAFQAAQLLFPTYRQSRRRWSGMDAFGCICLLALVAGAVWILISESL